MRDKEIIMKELEQAESAKFYNDMADHWNKANYEIDARLTEKIRALKAELEDLEG